MEAKDALEHILGERLKCDEPMATHTNFRIGGNAKYFFDVRTREEAVATLHILASNDVPWVTLGGGSNMLVADTGFDGAIIQMAMRAVQIKETMVTAEAGVLSAYLARATADAGLSGFTWAIGLPGTIGGAVRGNAGCYGGETKDFFREAEVLVVRDAGTPSVGVEREVWNKEQCAFAYRDSALKHLETPVLLLTATFDFPRGDVATEKQRLADILAQRKEKQPLDWSSAGCMFKNISVAEHDLTKLEKIITVPAEYLQRGFLPAGWLVQEAGLKGFAIGGAQVSEKHGNFCVNTGKATASDVVALTSAIKMRIRDTYGIQLEEEVQFVGF